jgi:(p)ppGpp synthase/HD superfamily hydrolase
MILSPRFEQALTYTVAAHSGQLRKGTSVPYVSHLLAVAGLVLEYGGDEEEAIAALLHDAVEDAGGASRLADIQQHFGARVAEIVAGCASSLVATSCTIPAPSLPTFMCMVPMSGRNSQAANKEPCGTTPPC